MAFRVSAAMALCFLFSLVVIARSIPLKEAGLTTNASSAAVTAAEVHAAPDGEGLLLLPYSDDSVDIEVEEEELMDNNLQAAQVDKEKEKKKDKDKEKRKEKEKKDKEKEKRKEKKKDKDKEKRKEKDKKKEKDKDKRKEKDKDDEEDEQGKKERGWRKKAISRSMFGHGRRSQREEAAKEEVQN